MPPPPSYNIAQSSGPVLANQAVPTHSRTDPTSSASQSPKMKSSTFYQLYGPPPSYESVISETLTEQTRTGGTPNSSVPSVHTTIDRHSEPTQSNQT